jgi:hypothetical protein
MLFSTNELATDEEYEAVAATNGPPYMSAEEGRVKLSMQRSGKGPQAAVACGTRKLEKRRNRTGISGYMNLG